MMSPELQGLIDVGEVEAVSSSIQESTLEELDTIGVNLYFCGDEEDQDQDLGLKPVNTTLLNYFIADKEGNSIVEVLFHDNKSAAIAIAKSFLLIRVEIYREYDVLVSFVKNSFHIKSISYSLEHKAYIASFSCTSS